MLPGQTGHTTEQMGRVPGTDGTHTRGCPAKILYVYWFFSFPKDCPRKGLEKARLFHNRARFSRKDFCPIWEAPQPRSLSPKPGDNKASRSNFRNQRFEPDTRKTLSPYQKQGSEETPWIAKRPASYRDPKPPKPETPRKKLKNYQSGPDPKLLEKNSKNTKNTRK